MQDWIGLLIAFVLGFFMKHLLGTVCQSRLVEGDILDDALKDAKDAKQFLDTHEVPLWLRFNQFTR